MNSRHGSPVTFDTFGGFYHAGDSDLPARKAVLLLSPIGYEEFCGRATWRALADMIAASGHACFRFDYPGTADAIDVVGEPDGIADWEAASRRCIDFLRERHPGCELVLVGQGFGASLAMQLGAETSNIAAAVLMAPVVKGRSYLRELQVWSRMLTEKMGIGPDPRDDNGYGVAGLPLPTGRAAAIKAIDLTRAAQPPAARVLVVERTQISSESAIGNHLKTLGAEVSSIEYAGYEAILQDPTVAEPQLGTLRRIVSWIDALPASPVAAAVLADEWAPARPLVGPHYEETPVRYGPGDQLFGILCRPRGRPASAIAVLANSGRNYHIGWGRAGVEQARALAARGIASLRCDAGGIGDSPAWPNAPAEVLYSDEQLADLRHSIDFAERLDAGPIAVAGRCSGAYAAFVTAVQDPRIHCVVPINMLRYVWDPEETVEQALQSAHRSVGGSVSKLFSKQSLRRLLSGNLRLWAPAVFLGKRVVRSVLARLRRGLAGASGASLYSECHRRFQVLEERGVRVAIVISEGDHAQGEFQAYMGRDGARLQRYPQASLTIIPDADHDFTHADARARLTNVLCDVISGDWSAVPRAQPAAHAGAYREIARS